MAEQQKRRQEYLYNFNPARPEASKLYDQGDKKGKRENAFPDERQKMRDKLGQVILQNLAHTFDISPDSILSKVEDEQEKLEQNGISKKRGKELAKKMAGDLGEVVDIVVKWAESTSSDFTKLVNTGVAAFYEGEEEALLDEIIEKLKKSIDIYLEKSFSSYWLNEEGESTPVRLWTNARTAQARFYLRTMVLVGGFAIYLQDLDTECRSLLEIAYTESESKQINKDPFMHQFMQAMLRYPKENWTSVSHMLATCVNQCISLKSLKKGNMDTIMNAQPIYRTFYSSIALILKTVHNNKYRTHQRMCEALPKKWTRTTSSIFKKYFGIDEKNIPLEIGVKITDMANDIQKDWLGLLYSESELYNGKVNMLLGDESLKTIVLNLEKRVSQWNLEKLFLSPSWLDEGYKEIIDSWSTDQKTQAEIYFRNMFLVYTLQLELQNLDKEKRKALLEIYTKKAPQEIRLISTPMFEAFQEMLKDPKADLTRILQMVAQCVAECKLKKDKEDLMVYIKDHSIYKMLYLSIALILQEAHEMIAAEWAHERYKL